MSLVLASVQGNSASPATAKQMPRLSGLCEGSASQNVLVAADIGASFEEEADYEARVAYRRTKRKGGGKRKEGGGGRGRKNKVMGGGQTFSGFY